jgi:glycosyltransferase involved in cell wall biosynthesis
MIKCVYLTPGEPRDIGGVYLMTHFDPSRYRADVMLQSTETVDNLWRSGDHRMNKMLEAFLRVNADADVIFCAPSNPFPPEWLYQHFAGRARLVLGCIDDPVVTYRRTIPTAWCFDGAFYVSPSYTEQLTMSEALSLWGCPRSFWWPLCYAHAGDEQHRRRVESSWRTRTAGVIYVGNLYRGKYVRLAAAKALLGDPLSIHGRWPLKGYAGYLASLKGLPVLPYRVTPLSDGERDRLYLQHKICLNLHYSERRETGNMRMYEAPWFGMMLLCDKAAQDMHGQIFVPGEEAIFYDSMEDAAEKARYYLDHDEERVRIARAGYERVVRDYDEDVWLRRVLDWASSLPFRHAQRAKTSYGAAGA